MEIVIGQFGKKMIKVNRIPIWDADIPLIVHFRQNSIVYKFYVYNNFTPALFTYVLRKNFLNPDCFKNSVIAPTVFVYKIWSNTVATSDLEIGYKQGKQIYSNIFRAITLNPVISTVKLFTFN